MTVWIRKKRRSIWYLYHLCLGLLSLFWMVEVNCDLHLSKLFLTAMSTSISWAGKLDKVVCLTTSPKIEPRRKMSTVWRNLSVSAVAWDISSKKNIHNIKQECVPALSMKKVYNWKCKRTRTLQVVVWKSIR